MRRPPFEVPTHDYGATASVHTRAELYYRGFVDEVDTEFSNDEDLFEAHLKVIIWGVLYIEGLVNYKLRALPATRRRNAGITAAWLKDAGINEKLDVAFAQDRVVRPWLVNVRDRFRKLVTDRNRLVHFRDKPTPFDLPSLVSKLGINASGDKWSEHTPHPRIVTHLLAVPLAERVETIHRLGDSLERL